MDAEAPAEATEQGGQPKQLSIHGGSRHLSRFCAAGLFGVIVHRITTSAELLRGPEPTEDCWATANGTLLGNREASSTEQLSIHGGSRLLSRFSAAASARADGNEDAVPIGTNSQGAVTHYGPSDLEAVLLRVSEPLWFNLSFDKHTDELGELQTLVAASNAGRLYSKLVCLIY